MRQLIMIVAFALVVGSGAIVAAQGATGQTDAPEAGAQADCGTPVDTLRISPAASPELEEIVETATPEITGGGTTIATAVASPDASPVAVDPCGNALPPVE